MSDLIGLNSSEKKVLAGLYKLDKATVGNIAKEVLVNRTTLYPILEKLLSKGLVSKVNIEGKIVFQSLTNDELKEWVKRKKEEVVNSADNLLQWIESQNKSTGTLLSEMKYYEGYDGVKNLYADTWRDNKEKMIYAITDYKSAYETMGSFFRKDYFPARVRHGVKVKNLIPESSEGRKDLKEAKQMLREMKFIKFFEDLGIEINIYDSKLAIVAFDKNKPSGVIIKNDKIAMAFKNIFNYLWETVK